MSKLNQQFRLHYPTIAYGVSSYEEFKTLRLLAAVGEPKRSTVRDDNAEGLPEYKNTVILLDTPAAIQACKDRLATSLVGKRVFIEPYGFREILPNDITQYIVTTTAELAASGYVDVSGVMCKDGDLRYSILEVTLNGELELNELYQKNYWYVLDTTIMTYEIVTEPIAKVKFSKGLLRNIIAGRHGDFNDRIADYARIIHFLTKKCETLMTPEEKAAFSFILTATPSLEELAKLDKVEEEVMTIVARHKA